jgi:hypothetical protein
MRYRPLYLAFCLLPAAAALAAEGRAPEAAESAGARKAERVELSASVGPLVGAASLELETQASGGSAWRLLAAVEAGDLVATFYPFSYRHIATVSADTLLPLSGSRQIQERDERWFFTFSYQHGKDRVELSRRAGGEPYGMDPIEGDTHDLLSALHYLRRRDPRQGAQFTLYENRRLYRISVAPALKEKLETERGPVPAWHYVLTVDPMGKQLTDPTVHLWISRHRDRTPLRVTASTSVGELVLELVQPEGAPTD